MDHNEKVEICEVIDVYKKYITLSQIESETAFTAVAVLDKTALLDWEKVFRSLEANVCLVMVLPFCSLGSFCFVGSFFRCIHTGFLAIARFAQLSVDLNKQNVYPNSNSEKKAKISINYITTLSTLYVSSNSEFLDC